MTKVPWKQLGGCKSPGLVELVADSSYITALLPEILKEGAQGSSWPDGCSSGQQEPGWGGGFFQGVLATPTIGLKR